jgi:hypothetical protein
MKVGQLRHIPDRHKEYALLLVKVADRGSAEGFLRHEGYSKEAIEELLGTPPAPKVEAEPVETITTYKKAGDSIMKVVEPLGYPIVVYEAKPDEIFRAGDEDTDWRRKYRRQEYPEWRVFGPRQSNRSGSTEG